MQHLELKNKFNSNGFTLIELLIVIAVIAILAAVVFVSLDPLARFQDARNAQRWTDVTAIAEAIILHQVNNQGVFDDVILDKEADTYYQIGEYDPPGLCADTCTNPAVEMEEDCIDLDSYLSEETIWATPYDPNAPGAGTVETRYYFRRNSNGSITVGACYTELGSNSSLPVIEVTR